MQQAIIIALYNTNNCFAREGAVLFGAPSYVSIKKQPAEPSLRQKQKNVWQLSC